MEKVLYNSLLYDFYAELATAKQREAYHMYYCDDLSLAEIGDKLGISRQAVNFSIKQALRCFEDLESALRLVESHFAAKECAEGLRRALEKRDFTESIKQLEKLERLL